MQVNWRRWNNCFWKICSIILFLRVWKLHLMQVPLAGKFHTVTSSWGWKGRLAGSAVSPVHWLCQYSPSSMPCAWGGHQIHNLENLSAWTYLRATFWKLYQISLRGSNSDGIKLGERRVRINCLVVFIKLTLFLCKVFAIILQSQAASSKLPYFLLTINDSLYLLLF